MQFFHDYFREKRGCEVLQTEHGFCAYRLISDVNLFFDEFYIHPDFRGQKLAWKLLSAMEEVALAKSCTTVSCTVQSGHALATDTMKAILAGGFKFKGFDQDKNLYFEKVVV